MFEFYKKKKIKISKINDIYSHHLYTGISGILMRYCHRQLERSCPKKNYKKILEIGAGSQPHYEYLKNKKCRYYILEKNKVKKNNKNKFIYLCNKNLKSKKKFFDRIIVSHTLEHIPFPDIFLKKTFKLLKNGGVMSISLPTDPGFLWRLGRLYNKLFIIKKNLNISSLDYDYMNSIEHINSCFNLLSIIKYNFRKKLIENYLPFKIKLIDLNLFYNVHIVK